MAQVVQGPHPVMSPYLAYDQYVLLEGNGNIVVFDDEGTSLDSFKSSIDMVMPLTMATMSANNPQVPILIGELVPVASYDLATEISKKMARSLIMKLRQIEAEGKCLAALAEHHVRVSPNGEIKLRGVQILVNLNPAAREALLRQMYHSASLIMDDLYGQHVPPDIGHLTNLMRNDFGARAMYPIHAALVPMTSFPSLYKELHDHVEFKIPAHDFHTILQGLANVANVGNWRQVVRTNRLLSFTLNFNQGKNYIIPMNRPNQISLYQQQRNALQKLRIPIGNQRLLTNHQLNLIRSLRFFDFMRNRIAHRNEAPLMIGGVLNQYYTAKGSEIVTRVRFPLVLPYIQLELHRMGLLSELDLDPLFD